MGDKKTNEVDFSQLHFRPAEPRDHEEVKALCRGALAGRDVLPARFLYFLKDPLRKLYVAVYKGRVVAIAASRMIDDGNTLESNFGRALPGLPGVFLALRRTLFETYAPAEFPKLKRTRGVVRNEKVAFSGSNVDAMPVIRVILDLAWKVPLTAIVEAINIYSTKFVMEKEQQCAAKRIDKSNLAMLFEETNFREKYIRNGIIVMDSAPLHLNYKSNLDIILADSSCNIFASYDTGNNMNALSFGTAVEMDVSMETLRYVIDYYGTVSVDSLIVHTMKHISTLPALVKKSKTAKDVYVAVFLLENTVNENILQQFVQFLSTHICLYFRRPKVPLERQFVLEGHFPLKSVSKNAKL